MDEFKVGDKFRLTGPMWDMAGGGGPHASDIVEVANISAAGSPMFYYPDDDLAWYIINDGRWDGEKVEED